MSGLPEASFSALRASRRLLNLPRRSNPRSGQSRKICHALNLRAFPAGALRPQFSRGRSAAPPRGWWPSGLASVSEAGGLGLGSPLARALFCVATSWFLAAGSFFVAVPWISASSRLKLWGASKVASRSAIARFFPYYSSRYKKLFPAAPADDVVRRRADFLQRSNRSVFLRGFARCLLPATRAHGCCCSQPFASRRARLFLPHGFRRAPPNSVF